MTACCTDASFKDSVIALQKAHCGDNSVDPENEEPCPDYAQTAYMGSCKQTVTTASILRLICCRRAAVSLHVVKPESSCCTGLSTSSFTSPGLVHVATIAYRDPYAITQAYSGLGPLHSFRSLVADHLCLHRLGSVQLNRIALTSCTATPHRIAIGDSGELHLLVCFEGHNQIQSLCHASDAKFTSRDLRCNSGSVALLPVGGFVAEGAHHLAVLRFSPTAVAAAGAALAGVEGWTSAQSRAFALFSPRCLPAAAAQALALHSLVRSMDQCLGSDPKLARNLTLDDVILRFVAGWLMPSPWRNGVKRDAQAMACISRSRDSFDALIDYIRANLDQPLRLSDLEARSHYSRRALQYAFRQRLGATPKQWIREQRLRKAVAQLGQPSPKHSVREIALDCGYRSLGHFSSDFRRLYGCSPSEMRGTS
jgi:AraC-like DNA-binding protein